MPEYIDIYRKRINRYGTNYQDRRINQRKEEFENYLLKSSYRIDFKFGDEIHPASFEKNQQDSTYATYYLLTHVDVILPNGTILWLDNERGGKRPWLVWYMEDLQISPYNRYIMLRLTHAVTWRDTNKKFHKGFCYFKGSQKSVIASTLRSPSHNGIIYTQNDVESIVIMPANYDIHVNDILIIGNKPREENFTVKNFDNQSIVGISYISVDPTYTRDFSPPPIQENDDESDEFFWLTGGDKG